MRNNYITGKAFRGHIPNFMGQVPISEEEVLYEASQRDEPIHVL